jgi:hypothetical protein
LVVSGSEEESRMLCLAYSSISPATAVTLRSPAAAARSRRRPQAVGLRSTPTNCTDGISAARGSTRLPVPQPKSTTVEPVGQQRDVDSSA